MFLTWKLWNALRKPRLRHPIVKVTRQERKQGKPLALIWRILIFIVALLLAFLTFLFPIPALLTIFALMLGIPALTLLFNGTVLGGYWVGQIAETFAREQRQGRFELMSLSPEGAIGAAWALGIGILYRHNWLETLYRILKRVMLIILLLLGFACFMLILGAFSAQIVPERENQLRILSDVLMIGFFLLALWLDHIQSIVLATILGLLLPQYQREEGLVSLVAIVVYLMLQLITYLLIVTAYQAAWVIGTRVFGDTLWSNSMIALVSLLIFYLLRETIIGLLWRKFLAFYHAKLADVELVA